jgi:hypothetical protein
LSNSHGWSLKAYSSLSLSSSNLIYSFFTVRATDIIRVRDILYIEKRMS